MLFLFFIFLEKLLCHLNYILSINRKDNSEFGLVIFSLFIFRILTNNT